MIVRLALAALAASLLCLPALAKDAGPKGPLSSRRRSKRVIRRRAGS